MARDEGHVAPVGTHVRTCRTRCVAWWQLLWLLPALSGCSAFDGGLLDEVRGPRGGDGSGAAPDGGGGPGSDLDDAGALDARSDGTLDGGGEPGVGPASGDGDVSPAGDGDGDGADDGTDAGVDPDDDASVPVDAGEPACDPSPLDDFCSAIPALPAAPVIDGALDCGVVGRVIDTSTWNGIASVPATHEARLAVAHRPDGLYVHVEVSGQAPVAHPMADPIYCGDVVELYVDADAVLDPDGAYDDPGTMQIIIAAPRSEAMPDAHAERYVRGATQGSWSGSYAIAWRANGYAVEAFIQAAELGLASWSPSSAVGLDVAIGVSGADADPDLRCGRLLGQHFLRVGTAVTGCTSGEPWCNAAAFCTPALQ